MTNNKERKKTSKNKKSKRKLIIFLIIVLIIIAVVFVIRKVTTVKDENQNDNNQSDEQKEIYDIPNFINMNNTENAKIEDGKKENTSSVLAKDKTVNGAQGIVITNIKLTADEKISYFTATVKNNSNSSFSGGYVDIQFTNSDSSDYISIEMYIPELNPEETCEMSTDSIYDLVNAYDCIITLKQ